MLRASLASIMAFVALLLPAPEPHADAPPSIAVDLLAPRGLVHGALSAICWTATEHGTRARILVGDRAGARILDRVIAAENDGTLQLAEAEQRSMSGAGELVMQIFLLAPDGELLGLSAPARATIAPDDRAR